MQALLEPQGLSADLMAEVLQWRLRKPDCDRGVVLDGLNSRYASAAGEGEGLDGLGDPHRSGSGGEEGGESTAAAPSSESGRRVAGTAKAALAAMPGARLLVLRFKGGNKGCVGRRVVCVCSPDKYAFTSKEVQPFF